MAGFLARAFGPFIGLGRAIVSFGLGAHGNGEAPQLPSGEVLLHVCDVRLARVEITDVALVGIGVCEPEIARIVVADTG